MDRVAELLQRIDELEEEVRQLREEKDCSKVIEWLPIKRLLGLKNQKVARLVLCLMKSAPQVVGRSRIESVLEVEPGGKNIDVYVCLARRAFANRVDAEIENVWGVGFRMSLKSRAAIREALDAKQEAA